MEISREQIKKAQQKQMVDAISALPENQNMTPEEIQKIVEQGGTKLTDQEKVASSVAMAMFTGKNGHQPLLNREFLELMNAAATIPAEVREGTYKDLLADAAQISGTDPDLMQVIAALFNLPDDEFDIIAPQILMNFEKSANNANDKMFLTQALNASGMKLDDFLESYQSILHELDTYSSEAIPKKKLDFLKKIMAVITNNIAETEGVAKRFIQVPIQHIHENAKDPAYAHITDAGMDVYAVEEITIGPGETKLIPLGIKVAVPLGYELQVRPKSGISLKTKLRVANAPGTIDSGYRDEVGVIIENIDPPIRAIHPRTRIRDAGENYESVEQLPITEGDIEFGQSYTIGAGEKFAQLVLNEVPKVSWYPVEDVGTIGENRGGGFGSTGLK